MSNEIPVGTIRVWADGDTGKMYGEMVGRQVILTYDLTDIQPINVILLSDTLLNKGSEDDA